MSFFDQLGGILQQYTNANAAQAPASVHDDFDKVATTAPTSSIADGIATAIRSNQTPAFSQIASQIFSNANGQQKAGMLNELLSAVNPGMLSSVLGGGALGSLLQGGQHVTPDKAENVSPQEVSQLAQHAEQHDPSIIDRMSNVYAQHPTLVKTLGGAALTIALAKIANKQSFG